jgi:ATP synthase I subunit
MSTAEETSTAIVRGVEYWTVGLGGTGALVAWLHWGWRAGAGVAAGALLSWVNYRWLKQGVIALTARAMQQAGKERVRAPRRVWLKFLGRFVLLAVAAYVILAGFKWSAIAVVSGLFAVVAGLLAEMILHLLRSVWQA